jgi:hypothetical protein
LGKRPIGPRTAAMPALGCSAFTRRAAFNAQYDLAVKGGATWGAMGGWFFFGNIKGHNGSTATKLMRIRVGATEIGRIQINYLYSLLWAVSSGANSTIATLTPYTWYYIAIEWKDNGNATYTFTIHRKTVGGALTSTVAGTRAFTGPFTLCEILSNTNGGAADWDGRVGMIDLYSLDAPFVYPTDVIEPPTPGGQTWYCSSSGSPTGDGLTPATAFSGWTRLWEDNWYCGIMPSTSGNLGTGDMLKIAAPEGNPIIADANVLTQHYQGTSILPIDGDRRFWVQFQKTLSNAAFTKTGGRTNIYQTTDTQAKTLMWEDGKLMAHPKLSDFANEAALLAWIDANPGSAWTNDTTHYVHAFNSTNVITDGKVRWRSYERSYADLQFGISATTEIGPWIMAGKNLTLQGLAGGYTMQADKTTNLSNGTYVLSVSTGTSGTTVVRGNYLFMGSKHNFGATFSADNTDLQFIGNHVDESSPFSDSYPTAIFMATGTGNTATIANNICLTSLAAVGQTLGGGTKNVPAIGIHNNADVTTGQYTTITIRDNYWPGGRIYQVNDVVTDKLWDIRNIYPSALFTDTVLRVPYETPGAVAPDLGMGIGFD